MIAVLARLPSLHTLILSEDKYVALTMANEDAHLCTWANDPTYQLILVPVAE